MVALIVDGNGSSAALLFCSKTISSRLLLSWSMPWWSSLASHQKELLFCRIKQPLLLLRPCKGQSASSRSKESCSWLICTSSYSLGGRSGSWISTSSLGNSGRSSSATSWIGVGKSNGGGGLGGGVFRADSSELSCTVESGLMRFFLPVSFALLALSSTVLVKVV